MSAPLIWVFVPLAAAVGVWFIQRQRRLAASLVTGLCLLLALIAATLPVGIPTAIGPLTIEVRPDLSILGRQLLLENSERTYVAMLFLMGALWFYGSYVSGAHRLFVPLGMVVLALMVAALAVEPFLFASLILEAAVLFSVPMLAPPGRPVGQGVLRYLIFQTLAVPFILLAGWAAANVEGNPSDSTLLVQAVFFLGLGFAFWLAIFPFYTWVPLLADETDIYVAGFLFSVLPVSVLLLGLTFLDTFGWLRAYPLLPTALRLTGILMVITGGVWAGFQTSLARMLGYAVILENGFSLLAFSVMDRGGLDAFALSLIPRMMAVALWALALAVLRQHGETTTVTGLRGVLRRHPIAAVGLAVGYFSLGGLPMLAGFPSHEMIVEGLAGQSLVGAGWVLIGVLAFWLGGFRLLSQMASPEGDAWQVGETLHEVVLLLVGILSMLAMGLFSNLLLPGMLQLLQAFSHL